MDEFRGIVLYNIERNGNLNGVYTNNHPVTESRIFTETARLVDDTLIEGNTEIHIYESCYFDAINGGVNRNLTFRISDGIINAQWSIGEQILFVGQGFQMNERQIAITYERKKKL